MSFAMKLCPSILIWLLSWLCVQASLGRVSNSPCWTMQRPWPLEMSIATMRIGMASSSGQCFLATGRETGAASSGKALPPLISFGLGVQLHFEAALRQQQLRAPFEQLPLTDQDLHFAMTACANPSVDLRRLRSRMTKRLQELSRTIDFTCFQMSRSFNYPPFGVLPGTVILECLLSCCVGLTHTSFASHSWISCCGFCAPGARVSTTACRLHHAPATCQVIPPWRIR